MTDEPIDMPKIEPMVPKDGCVNPPAPAAPRLRRLTRFQYENALKDVFGIEAGSSTGWIPDGLDRPFENEANAQIVTRAHVDQYAASAFDAAQKIVPQLKTILPCATNDPSPTCLQTFENDIAWRLFRRPLSDAERQDVEQLFDAGKMSGGFAGGIENVIAYLLQSPSFLYVVPDVSDPGQDATALSLFLWDSLPDPALLHAAFAGDLRDVDGLHDQILRMVKDPKSQRGLDRFFSQWLGLEKLDGASRDPKLYPDFSPESAQQMRTGTLALSRYAVEAGSLEDLLSAPTVFATAGTAKLYGLKTSADLSRPSIAPAGQRAGILTDVGVLTALAKYNRTAPVARGKFIREQILCEHVPEPPPTVDDNLPPPAQGETERDVLAAHREDPACAGCHALFDPLGLALENYDAMGAYRTNIDGMAIDASGTFEGLQHLEGGFENAIDMARMLSVSQEASICFSQTLGQFSLARPLSEDEVNCLTPHTGQPLRDLFVATAKTLIHGQNAATGMDN